MSRLAAAVYGRALPHGNYGVTGTEGQKAPRLHILSAFESGGTEIGFFPTSFDRGQGGIPNPEHQTRLSRRRAAHVAEMRISAVGARGGSLEPWFEPKDTRLADVGFRYRRNDNVTSVHLEITVPGNATARTRQLFRIPTPRSQKKSPHPAWGGLRTFLLRDRQPDDPRAEFLRPEHWKTPALLLGRGGRPPVSPRIFRSDGGVRPLS
jgi:hypothetical protein